MAKSKCRIFCQRRLLLNPKAIRPFEHAWRTRCVCRSFIKVFFVLLSWIDPKYVPPHVYRKWVAQSEPFAQCLALNLFFNSFPLCAVLAFVDCISSCLLDEKRALCRVGLRFCNKLISSAIINLLFLVLSFAFINFISSHCFHYYVFLFFPPSFVGVVVLFLWMTSLHNAHGGLYLSSQNKNKVNAAHLRKYNWKEKKMMIEQWCPPNRGKRKKRNKNDRESSRWSVCRSSCK